MRGVKNYWKNTWQYKRILEILEDYWLTEKEEDYVKVNLYFEKGEERQSKTIEWRRNRQNEDAECAAPIKLKSLAEIENEVLLRKDEKTTKNGIKIPEMATLREASKKTGLSYDHLRKLCLSKEIAYIKAGAKFLVNMDKLVEYMQGGINA